MDARVIEEYLSKGFSIVFDKRSSGFYRVRVVKTIGVVSEEEAEEIRKLIEKYKTPKTTESSYITFRDLPERLRKLLFLLDNKGYIELNDEYVTAGLKLKPFITLLKNPNTSINLDQVIDHHSTKACGDRGIECGRILRVILESFKRGETIIPYSKLLEEAGIRE